MSKNWNDKAVAVRKGEELDKEANRLGVERQSLIKFWISERLDDIVSK